MRKKLEETLQGQGMSEFRWNLEKLNFSGILVGKCEIRTFYNIHFSRFHSIAICCAQNFFPRFVEILVCCKGGAEGGLNVTTVCYICRYLIKGVFIYTKEKSGKE